MSDNWKVDEDATGNSNAPPASSSVDLFAIIRQKVEEKRRSVIVACICDAHRSRIGSLFWGNQIFLLK